MTGAGGGPPTRRLRVGVAALVVAAVTAGALGWVVSTTRNLRAEARERFFELYNRQQLLLAQQAARTIEGVFGTFRRNLTLVANLFRAGDVTPRRAAAVGATLRTVYQTLADTPVIDLVVFDRRGTVVGIVPENPETLGRNYSWREYYRWARERGRPGRMYLSPFLRLEGGRQKGAMALIVAEGIYGPSGEFKGVAMMTVNFDELARRHVLSIRMGAQGYAWLLDSVNRSILVDPRGRFTGQTFEQAFLPRWPKLFALASGTAGGRPALDWYDYEDPRDPRREVRKLVGHAPVRIEDFVWTLGVCTPEEEVERLLASFFDRQQTFATALVAATLAGAAALLGLLVAWNRSLSREVATRTGELLDARGRLSATFDELLAARKLAAVGRLALGLVHEIRNPLSSIRMNMQMIRRRTAPEGGAQENFAIMEEEILRLNRLLTDVLSFARPAPLRLATADLREVIRRVLDLLARRLEEAGIEAEGPWVGEIPPVVCDAEQLHQVFLNLLLNAVQALEAHPGPRRISVHGTGAAGWATVAVSDTGPGIAPEKRDTLFEPFFTTKAQGTGLGLSIVHSIVARHGGAVEVATSPGQGTTFTVRLPVRGPEPVPGGSP